MNIMKKTNLVVLGLGSNLGDSRSILINAAETLKTILCELKNAPLYKTDPLYVLDQGCFINTAVAGFYDNSPGDLLKEINKIEKQFGRNRAKERRWGERSLDIDILLFGNEIINSPDLVIPHPRLKERRFALEPLLKIIPEAREPGTGLFYQKVCETLPNQGVSLL